MRDGFLYQHISQDIHAQIAAGTLKPGDKLPSLRALSRQRGVSVTTVSQAYLELEAQGQILVRPQSGYYVTFRPTALAQPEIATLDPVPSLVGRDALIERVTATLRQPGIVPLGSTTLDASLLPNKALQRLIQQASRQPEVYASAPAAGHVNLRRQIAQRTLDSRRPVLADDVVITSGCMEALNLSLRLLCQPGDVIAVESPCFYGILQAIESLGLRALEIPASPQTGLSLDALREALAQYRITAVVTVPSFQNPLGCCMPLEHKRQFLKLAEDHDFQIIEDDIYGEFYFGNPPPTLYALDTQDRVILCSSFSKTVAPGFRVGWALPGRRRERFLQLKRMTSLSTASLPQYVLAEYLGSGAYQRYLRRLRQRLAENHQLALPLLAQGLPPGTRISQPEGGFVFWIALPEPFTGIAFYEAALAAGIGVAPGAMFSTGPAYDHCVRLSLSLAWGPRLEGALQALGQIAQQLKKPVREKTR
jgi:DNA-binding transcriptional MocR family regulator